MEWMTFLSTYLYLIRCSKVMVGTVMSWMFLLLRIRTSVMAAMGRAAFILSLMARGVVVFRRGVPSQVMRRVLSCLEGAAGVVLVDLEGLGAFLPAPLAHECWGGAAG